MINLGGSFGVTDVIVLLGTASAVLGGLLATLLGGLG